jgi:small neutral amino acid transporter SnatA (MarC family)
MGAASLNQHHQVLPQTPGDKPDGNATPTNATPSGINKLIIGEAIIGSLLILAGPFLGEYFEGMGGGKTIAVVLAIAHYGFHIIGGAVLFKAGLDWGKHQH